MDRKNPQLAKLQESFINHLVAPLCNAYAESGLMPGVWLEPDSPDILDSSEGSNSDDIKDSMFTSPKELTIDEDEDCSKSTTSDMSDFHRRKPRKIFCLQTQHLQDNHTFWVNRIKVRILFMLILL